MAPKKRHTRIDAAYDNLCPLGFSKSLIRSKIKSLLKVYGEEGWAFFEADAYRVLIEAILEEEEDKHSLKSGSIEDAVEASSISNQQQNQVAEAEHARRKSEPEPMPELELDKKPDFLALPLPSVLSQEHVASPPRLPVPSVLSQEPVATPPRLPVPSVLSQEPVATPPLRKRKRCRGWISNDDEEDDTVFLETVFSSLRQNCGSDSRKRKSRSRWDIKPEDL